MAREKVYLPSTEQIQYLFPELEIYDTFMNDKEPEQVEVAAHQKRKPQAKTCQVPPDAPVCDVYHDSDSPDQVEIDGVVYERCEDRVINKIAFLPSKWIVERHHYSQFKSKDVDVVVDLKAGSIEATAASASLLATIAVRKFDDHLPLYRQQEIYQREGSYLSRQKMASWLIKQMLSIIPLEKVYEKWIYKSNLLNKDETPVQILDVKGPGRRPATNCFMYITIGSTYDADHRKTRRLLLMKYIKFILDRSEW